MMSLALSGKWSTPAAEIQQPEPQQHNPEILEAEVRQPGPQHNHPETLEAEVVEPVEAGSQKWGAQSNFPFALFFLKIHWCRVS